MFQRATQIGGVTFLLPLPEPGIAKLRQAPARRLSISLGVDFCIETIGEALRTERARRATTCSAALARRRSVPPSRKRRDPAPSWLKLKKAELAERVADELAGTGSLPEPRRAAQTVTQSLPDTPRTRCFIPAVSFGMRPVFCNPQGPATSAFSARTPFTLWRGRKDLSGCSEIGRFTLAWHFQALGFGVG